MRFCLITRLKYLKPSLGRAFLFLNACLVTSYTFFSLYGHLLPLSITACTLFSSSLASFGYRLHSFFLFMGIYCLARLPLTSFFPLYGHLLPLSVTANTFFSSLRVSIAPFDYRVHSFFLFMGIYSLARLPLTSFFPLYGHL